MSIATLILALIAVTNAPAGSGEPIMLDFTASWCGPCRQMKPTLEQLARQGLPIKAIDVDQSPDLASKYQISGIPAFLVIDPADGRVLARSEGSQPAEELVALYHRGRAKLDARQLKPAATEAADADARAEDEPAAPRAGGQAAPNPKPWETVVRIKVHGNGSIGFGSGTVIHSTPEESLILTCAHIFKLDGRQQAHPSRFPLRITVDFFDGNLTGPKRNQVSYAHETVEGKAVDYDFARDVGLIRIRPGRRIPYAKVVPPHWTPKANMGVITVGCSEGHDATAWSTVISNPRLVANGGNYEAIECMVAPRQGRSGGGLFTSDGYVAGVCDFAEPQGNHGLYAHPSSIYAVLDRNKLMALYSPRSSQPDTQIASREREREGSRFPESLRGQSPERENLPEVQLPPPDMFGIKAPELAQSSDRRLAPKRMSWRPSPGETNPDEVKPVEIRLDPKLDPDHFGASPFPEPEPRPEGSAPSAKESNRDGKAHQGQWRRSTKPLEGWSLPQAN